MRDQHPQKSNQSLNISDSVLETVQIGGVAGRDLNLTQVQGGVGSINVFGTIQVDQAPLSPEQSLSREEYEWRRVLLSKVKQFWIDGVLTKSLHTQALIELGLEDCGDYVPTPLEGMEEFSSDSRKVLPSGTSATDVFEGIGAGRTLLILGEPGSGKTVTLLKLAESLLKRAENDVSQPLPILVNLSSWSRKRASIDTWLSHELYETYQVSQSLGKRWIDNEQLIILLDGLDEVTAKYRNSCVRALNHFTQTHGRTEMVVCSRIRDYEALPEQLNLRSAIYVQPLNLEQINQYLEQAGEQLTVLRTVFNEHPTIQQFASSPLILSIMSLAYQGCSLDSFQDVTTVENFHQNLFETYIERMFIRKGRTQQYSQEKTRYWLIWIAQQMLNASQTVFLIERMQANMLQNRSQKLQYHLESGLLSGLFTILINALIFGLIFGLLVKMEYGLIVRLFFGLFAGIVTGGIYGISTGLLVGFLGKIQTVETLRWSWNKAKKSLLSGIRFGIFHGSIIGLLLGSIIGFITGISQGLLSGITKALLGGIILALAFGLGVGSLIGLCIGTVGGFRGPELQAQSIPNQGIWKSAHNALKVGFLSGLIGGSITIVIFALYPGLAQGNELEGLNPGLSYIGFYGSIGALIGGGAACIQHFSLRFILWRKGYLPWNYSRFLDYAAERLFLQKVGGGYIFVHRMLLEHFAAMKL